MKKHLVLTKGGKMNYYKASKENVSKNKCNYISNQNNNKSIEDFCKRIEDVKLKEIDNNKIYKIKNLDINDKVKLIESEEVSDEILDVLVTDESWYVRAFVAKYGRDKDLDILVSDKDPVIRSVVAGHNKNKYLDILVNDKNQFIRKVVAKHGRDKDLDILINDKSQCVRDEVIENKNFKYDKRLANGDGRLEMIKKGCSEKEMDFIIRGPKNKDIRLELMKKKLMLKFIVDKN